ncbi:unnamed protein product, partial [Urochloa humidicola]
APGDGSPSRPRFTEPDSEAESKMRKKKEPRR